MEALRGTELGGAHRFTKTSVGSRLPLDRIGSRPSLTSTCFEIQLYVFSCVDGDLEVEYTEKAMAGEPRCELEDVISRVLYEVIATVPRSISCV